MLPLARPHPNYNLVAATITRLKIQAAGGDILKKTNLFYGGTRVYYGGGSIVSFLLLNTDGAVLSAANLWSEMSYLRDKAFKNGNNKSVMREKK